VPPLDDRASAGKARKIIMEDKNKDKKMEMEEYQELCRRYVKKFETEKEKILTWGLGIAGEAGDVAGCIKKTYIHENDQTAGIKENLGDVLWYIAVICNFYGWNMRELLKENMEKLEKRYPRGFKLEEAKRGGERVDWNEK